MVKRIPLVHLETALFPRAPPSAAPALILRKLIGSVVSPPGDSPHLPRNCRAPTSTLLPTEPHFANFSGRSGPDFVGLTRAEVGASLRVRSLETGPRRRPRHVASAHHGGPPQHDPDPNARPHCRPRGPRGGPGD